MHLDILKRGLAPIVPEAWRLIDAEAARVLALDLAARKLVDFDGPHGIHLDAVSTGRLELFDEPLVPEVKVGLRRVQPLIEVRTPIRLDLFELDQVARGATDPDLDAVVRAAERTAHAEDHAVFAGYRRAGITGIIEASPHAPSTLAEPAAYPRVLLEAKETLRAAGVGGPYGVALGLRAYEEVYSAAEDGHSILHRIQQIVDGPIVRARGLDGAVLLSIRGGDFELTVGQDLAIGYAFTEKHSVELYLTESFTFRVLEPSAAVHLKHKGRDGRGSPSYRGRSTRPHLAGLRRRPASVSSADLRTISTSFAVARLCMAATVARARATCSAVSSRVSPRKSTQKITSASTSGRRVRYRATF